MVATKMACDRAPGARAWAAAAGAAGAGAAGAVTRELVQVEREVLGATGFCVGLVDGEVEWFAGRVRELARAGCGGGVEAGREYPEAWREKH
ncbi:hypothetical protein HDU96_001101 [Phlyctochytrium bullatum]|nr:hypothetical protein HDU96_001101 [Phlyctochytrium bullatum]